MSQSDEEQNFNHIEFNEQYEEYSNIMNNNITHYRTEFKQEKPQVTIQRFQTLMLNEANTKNIPKTFGNNFKKFMDNIILEDKGQINKSEIPQCLDQFLIKKSKGQQSSYILKDFKTLFSNEICSKWFQFYIENCAFLDLLHSNRIENVEEYILFIEQYLAGAQDPENFISNRQLKRKKEEIKIQKAERKLDELILDYDSNIQLLGYNDNQSSNNHKVDDESDFEMSVKPLLRKK
ncbi:unnamed protein product [Paramecium sonneborni]|uniref:Uncharacterized protein n=1 Tax=Paramecium sonneborni TaxID=65129 RepID=A0A8S1LV77_9CILI|nr:unnamed protein product [Paramecium sonneborni]